jgi:bifunctional non-homologous end joining protein LigD
VGEPERLIPRGPSEITLSLDAGSVTLTNLNKLFWPERGTTKGDLLRYYASVAPYLVPHLRDRAMVMKRYPHGWAGDFFFMKRAPKPRPDFIELCSIAHASGNVIDFPMVQDLASLLWVVNLGCIDLNPWYARCDDVDRPDFLHFDLDPVPPATFSQVQKAALVVREGLAALGLPAYAKTSGSKGVHVYVPIVRGPTQKEVWRLAKSFAHNLARLAPALLTAEYRKDARPSGRVLVDYNQNAWGRTLASVYSVRPTASASVSMPVTWEELERGVHLDDFRLDNALARLSERGDLFAPLLAPLSRARLESLL